MADQSFLDFNGGVRAHIGTIHASDAVGGIGHPGEVVSQGIDFLR
jgi:hypothetical protein